MDMLLKTHSEGDLPDDDPQTSYLISAWARICKILGKILLQELFMNAQFFKSICNFLQENNLNSTYH